MGYYGGYGVFCRARHHYGGQEKGIGYHDL